MALPDNHPVLPHGNNNGAHQGRRCFMADTTDGSDQKR